MRPKIPLDNLDNILANVNRKYRLFSIDHLDGEAIDVVRYLGKKNDLYNFDGLTTRAKWKWKLKLAEKEIRYINFDESYVNSLKLVTKF